MEALQGAPRRFGVKGAGRYVVGAEVVEHGPRDRGLAYAALVGAYDDHCWFGHLVSCSPKMSPHSSRVRPQHGRKAG